MHKYQLIEFNFERKEVELISNKSNLQQVLKDFYKKRYDKLFEEDGCPKGYISVFINSKQTISTKDISLRPHDEICIVASISGG